MFVFNHFRQQSCAKARDDNINTFDTSGSGGASISRYFRPNSCFNDNSVERNWLANRVRKLIYDEACPNDKYGRMTWTYIFAHKPNNDSNDSRTAIAMDRIDSTQLGAFYIFLKRINEGRINRFWWIDSKQYSHFASHGHRRTKMPAEPKHEI